MFPSSNYINWDYDPPQSNVQDTIIQMVHDAVNVEAQTIAESVAQEAKVLLGDQVLLKTDVYVGTNVGLGRTPTATGTNNLFLGRNAGASITVGGNNVIVGGYQGASGTADTVCLSNASGVPLMQWVGTNRSPVQSLDVQGAAPTLSVDGTMALSFATDHLVSTVRAGGQSVTLNLYDSSKYILQSDLDPILQSLSRLKGTDVSVVLGAASTNAAYETIIGGKTSSRTFMSWPVNKLSAIQSIDQSTTLSSLTMPNNTMALGYDTRTSVPALVTRFMDASGTPYTLNLQDAAQFATAANLLTVTATVNAHTTQLTKLNGTGTSVVLGAPLVDAAYETIIGGKTTGRSFMSWPINRLSSIQSIDQSTAVTSLTLPNSAMVQSYITTSVPTLVTRFTDTTGTAYTLNLQDAAQFATATSLSALNTTVTGHTTQLTKLNGTGTSVVLGAPLVDATYETIIGGKTTGRSFMSWPVNRLSAVQSIDQSTTLTSLTMTNNTLALGYDTRTSVPALVTRFIDANGVAYTLNLLDSAQFPTVSSFTTLSNTVQNHTNTLSTLSQSIGGGTTITTTELTKLDGTGTSVVLGAAAMDAMYDAMISGTFTNSSRILMKWRPNKLSAIQTIDPLSNISSETLATGNLMLGYDSTTLPTLVARFNDGTSTRMLNLRDASVFASYDSVTSLQSLVNGHTTKLTKLDGTGTSVVLGAAPVDATYETIIGGTNSTHTFMRWKNGNLSVFQSIDQSTAVTSLTLPNSTMVQGYVTTSVPTLVSRFTDTSGTAYTLNLQDAAQFATAAGFSTLNTTVTGHTTQISSLQTKVTKLDGTGTSAVLGAAPVDATYETIIGGTNSTHTFMRWKTGSLSAFQSIDQSTAVTSLTLPNSTMVQGYITTSVPTLVTRFTDTSGTAYTLNLQDAAQFATAASVYTLNTTVTVHTTQLASLTSTVDGHTTQLTKLNGTGTSVVLGAPLVDAAYETIIGGKTTGRSFMSWPINRLSSIQSIDQSTALTSLTLPNSTMLQGYLTTSVPTLVTRFTDTTGTTYTLNLQDAAQFATAANLSTVNTTVSTMNTTVSTMNTTVSTMNTTVTGHTTQLTSLQTKVTKLDGTGTSAVLGSAPVDATCDAIISGTSTNSSRVLMKWLTASKSAIQSVDDATTLTTLTLPANNLAFGYTTTPLPTLVSMFSDNSGTKQTLYHSMYRPMLDLTNGTGNNVCTFTTACANRFCVYTATTGFGTQTINLCHGFEAGTEIEIFNNSATSVNIVPPAAQTTPTAYAAADLFSVNQNRNINAYGAAVIKVYKKGDAVIKPVFFLIGSLS